MAYKKRITDLEAFVLSEVYRPYQNALPLLGKDGKRIERLGGALTLDEAVTHLNAYPDWAALVVGRIRDCGYWFPHYLSHPLIDYLTINGCSPRIK
jgi:hypothetical protein